MRKYLLDLYEIQKIDLEIRESQKALDAVPSDLRQVEGRIVDLQAKIATLRDQSNSTLSEAQSQRQLVDEEVRKIRKWESRLNDLRNQREYQALSRETEGSRRANRDAEERINELLKNKETMDSELLALETALGEAQDHSRKEKARVDELCQGMGQQLATQQARREELIPKLPKALFRKYDAIRQRRLGLGLARVVAGCCQGCNIRLPPQLYNILQRGDSIEQCPSCHRLIFWEQLLEDDEPKAAAAASASV